MDARRLLALVTILAVITIAVGVPMWTAPYGKMDEHLLTGAMLPGIVLLASGTLYLVVAEAMRARRALMLMGACAPIADIILIVRDTSADPTTHNLFPFELILVTLWGLMFIVPAMLIGVALRAWVRRQAG
jgi:hypothetical protein